MSMNYDIDNKLETLRTLTHILTNLEDPISTLHFENQFEVQKDPYKNRERVWITTVGIFDQDVANILIKGFCKKKGFVTYTFHHVSESGVVYIAYIM